jgi:ATP-dependent DNA helicase RecQ
MPTGGGKSITFQVFSLSTEGVCLVVTPLIALMKDQVENLRKKGIKALAIYSGMTKHEIEVAMNNAVYGDYKFLYVSPERLSSPRFKDYFLRLKLNLITVDEAHCISQWGYDFRPSYLKISDLRDSFPETPLLALTATATLDVVDDIQDKLKFKKKNVLVKSFIRDNLAYIVRIKDDKTGYLLDTVKKAKGSGIVYVRTRKKTKEISELLRRSNISAEYYHGGLDNEIRSLKQESWMKGETQVIVATNAFGMGIDKPDVRFVVHIDPPDSLEAYFQEAGRAGRDENKAGAVLLFNKTDKRRLRKFVTDSFPEIKTIKRVYQALGNYFELAVGSGIGQFHNFVITDFTRNFKLNISTVYNSIKLLQREGYIEHIEEVNNSARVYFKVRRDELYKFQVENSSFDAFIKLLLRSYTGLFTDYVNISEHTLARNAKTTPETINRYLTQLSSLKIIHFIPRRINPIIIYTKERVAEKQLKISADNYDKRKKRYESRVEHVINYASHETKCRSEILLKYFGQENSGRCGKCDICLSTHDSGISNYSFNLISDSITKVLQEKKLKINDLLEAINISKEKEHEAIQIARYLLDNDIIAKNEAGKLSLN